MKRNRSTLSAHPRRPEGHHADGRRGGANFQASLGNVLVRQASESKSTFRTVHSTYRKDRCVKVASPESDVQPCVSKPALPCRVREAQLSPCRSSAENDCTNDYGTHKTTSTSPGTLGAVSGSPGGAASGLARHGRTDRPDSGLDE